MVTQQQIAKKAGVSISMVSRVLSGWADNGGVSKANVAKIRKLAKKYAYRPNIAGRALRTRKSHTVGILFSARSILYRELVPELQSCLFRRGYSAVCGFWNTVDDADNVISAVASGLVDGLIASHPPAEMKRLVSGLPVVHFMYQDPDGDAVYVDKKDVLNKVVHHLTSLGHRRLFFIDCGVHEGKDFIGEFREAGLVAGAAEWANAASPDGLHTVCRDSLRQILDVPAAERPTAFVCADDATAVLVVTALQNMGYKVPGDISVVGSEVLDIGKIVMPAITTCGPGKTKIAEALVDAMMNRLNAPDTPPQDVPLLSEVIARDSTGPAPVIR